MPLEKVTSDIRGRIVRAQIEAILESISKQLSAYRTQRINYDAALQSPETTSKPKPPKRPSFAALAKKYGLEARKTGLISDWQAAELDIGGSAEVPQEEQRVPFVQFAYESFPSFRPAITRDYVGNYYLFWKIDDSPEKVQEFHEPGVREQVLKAWREEQARELAKKAAERWAAAVRAKKQPLAAVLAGKPGVGPVYQTEPFSWLTYGGLPAWLAQRPPMLSQIKARVKDPVSGLIEEKDAVDMPGQNFMRAVFNLRPGEVGVAMNQPETYVYVVQVTETAPSAEVLWRTFVKENDNTYMWTGQTDQFAAIRAWLAEMQSAAGLKWERPIQQTRGGGE